MMKILMPYCALLGAVLLGIAMPLIFIYAPEEASLGIIQKIFYIHVSVAWWGFASFFCVFITSIVYIKKRCTCWHHFSLANAEVGVLFTAFTLVTGMIWGKHSWGVWWTWDPRLTTALLLFFIYMGYLIIQGMDIEAEKKRIFSAVLGIIAFIDVPLVFFSARIWRSIHPAVFTKEGSGLTPTMLFVFLFTLGSLFFLWIALVYYRYYQLELQHAVEEKLATQTQEYIYKTT